MFQFTRPRGARRAGSDGEALFVLFQFTRPRGARRGGKKGGRRRGSFNSRAREGRDGLFRGGSELLTFCFNSRAREGRDGLYDRFLHIDTAFQFTRPRGARLNRYPGACSPVLFQFTRPRGARPSFLILRLTVLRVSIHAPARGATVRLAVQAILWGFQFTRPRGARPIPSSHILGISCFNSRAREGRDSGTFDAGISLLLQGGIRGARCK